MDLLQLVRLAGAKVTKRKRSASCQEGSGSNSFSPPTPKSKMDRDPQSEHVPDDDEIAALVVVAGAVSVLHWLCGNDTPIESIPIDVDSGGEPSKGTGTRSMSVSQSKGKKKASSSKRSRDRNWDALEGMTNAVCKVADALTAKHSVDESRALKLMDSLKPLAVYGFNEDQIDSACEHLLLAPTTAAMFFARSTERRVIWMTNFCAQNCPNN